MSKKHSARQPAFSRLSSRIQNMAKRWYKKYTARRNRKKLHQSRDIESHQDRPLDPWSLD